MTFCLSGGFGITFEFIVANIAPFNVLNNKY